MTLVNASGNMNESADHFIFRNEEISEKDGTCLCLLIIVHLYIKSWGQSHLEMWNHVFARCGKYISVNTEK